MTGDEYNIITLQGVMASQITGICMLFQQPVLTNKRENQSFALIVLCEGIHR